MDNAFSASQNQPITLTPSVEAKTYGLTALAVAITFVGVYVTGFFANMLLSTGLHFFFLFAELGIIVSARWWINRSPLNYFLFALFPLLSGITITPYLLYILDQYTNGASILFNALAATFTMLLLSAVVARSIKTNLGGMTRFLIVGLLGLIAMGILQVFVPSLRTGTFELVVSGVGVLFFAGFLVYDLQKIQRLGRIGMNPFLLALSLYLDLFNLFLYLVRFMSAFSGGRRRSF